MIAVLTIGGRHYAFKKPEEASRVLTLLAGAQQLEQTFHWKKSAYFFHPKAPESLAHSHSGTTLEMVHPSRITEAFSDHRGDQPDEPKPLAAVRRLPARVAQRQITGGAR